MNFELKTMELSGAASEKCDALLVLLPASFKPEKDALSALVKQTLKAGDFELQTDKPEQVLMLYRPTGVAGVRVVLVGIGDGSAKQVRKAVLSAMQAVKSAKLKKLAICFAGTAQDDSLRSALTVVAESSYVFTTTKSKPEGRSLETVAVGLPGGHALQAVFDQTCAAVTGIEFAKEWANRPANYATPTLLADAAQSLAKFPGVKCRIHGPKEVAKLGMGAFMAVARGSQQPLRFIELHYNGAAKSVATTVLVGKGITFDSGGISIKPAAEMDEMKFDMSGAASVLGLFRALAVLKPAINVVGLIPSCENLPDGLAVKPGDVVTSMSGQTIEVLNTDAEGRLVLCDALTYAERFKPRAVIDIATLTGACMIALGGVRSGMFASDDALADALLAAGQASADLCWRMPLDDEYAEGLKSNFADVANLAGRMGGAITAAKFLQRFAGKFAWAHLDIAGTAWKSGTAKGATGRPVALLLQYLLATAK